jgi:hypothetical protein
MVCRYLIVNSRLDERLLKVLYELTGNKVLDNDNEDVPDRVLGSQASESHSCQLILLNGKEFSPEPCRQRLLGLKIPYEPKDNSVEDHNLFISSLIPFHCEIMIRAAGALLKYLDKSAMEIFQIDLVEGQVPVLDIKICTMYVTVLFLKV